MLLPSSANERIYAALLARDPDGHVYVCVKTTPPGDTRSYSQIVRAMANAHEKGWNSILDKFSNVFVVDRTAVSNA